MKKTEVIWAALISKLLVSLIVSLGIGLSSLVNSSPAEAGGFLTSESKKGGKANRSSMSFRADTFKTVSCQLKRSDAKIKLPDEYVDLILAYPSCMPSSNAHPACPN